MAQEGRSAFVCRQCTVRITRPSDSNFRKGQIVSMSEFLRTVEYVLVNGGEMPTAELESCKEVPGES